MKQFQILTESCSKRIKINSICRNNFEEKRSFLPGWIEYSQERLHSSISQSFQYRSSDDGYIDQQTRLIEIQMSLYNPNVQLFTFVTLQTEFLSTGSIHFQSRFEPMHFYGKS
ncbi:unnamed protein product [Rotaria sp. Silwood2]|nr:unnamed protein product [Rotaria sp. Silwood2]CAF3441030.1 unnamed protein product [Rotaria sp. Silwood2]CAF4517592.1 unnamed protein product [Rotaria sp. Silwood2]